MLVLSLVLVVSLMDNETRKMLGVILNKLDVMQNDISSLKGNQIEMQKDVSYLKDEVRSLKDRQAEIFHIVSGIEHSNQVHKAEIDNLNVRVAKNEGTFNRIKEAI